MIKYFDDIKKLKYKYNLSYHTIYKACSDSNTNEELISKLELLNKDFYKSEESEREKKINRIIECINATFDFTIADDCLDMLPKWTLIDNEPYCLFGIIDSYYDIYWICVNKDKLNKFAYLPCYMHIDNYDCDKKFTKKEINKIIVNLEKNMNHDKERMIYNKLIDKIYD